jgi:WD domain, G-beta repeat
MVVSSSQDKTIRLWETATGKERLCLRGHEGWVWSPVVSPDGKTLASASGDRTVRLWDVRDGKELHIFRGHLSTVYSVDFSLDVRRLVSGSEDTTALVWEIPEGLHDRKPPAPRIDRLAREKLWKDLASVDAAAAYAAMQQLTASPALAVALCKERLSDAFPPTQEQIERWIAKLDDDAFAVREKANEDLEGAGASAEKTLRRTLKAEPSPEVRQRVEALLESLENRPLKPEVLRGVRAVEILDRIGSPEAVDLLRRLSQRNPDPRILMEAKASLRRLVDRNSDP